MEGSFPGVQQFLDMPFTAEGLAQKKQLKKLPICNLCSSTLSSVWSAPRGKSQGFESSLSKHLEQTLDICKNHRVYS